MFSAAPPSVAANVPHPPTFPRATPTFAQFAAPWWLWLNILSLDAPLVAVAWAALFAHASALSFHASEAATLAFSVWIIYVTDRLLDVRPSQIGRAPLHERHSFCRRHRFVLGPLLIVASSVLLYLIVCHLPVTELVAGLKLSAILLLYLAGIHAAPARLASIVPKEIVVGLLFAAGTSLSFWSRLPSIFVGDFLPWLFFGLLCCLNCLSIECWENPLLSRGVLRSPLSLVPWARPRLSRLAALLAVCSFAASCLPQLHQAHSVLSAISLAAFLLFLLDTARYWLSPSALRVLADAALLLPAIIALTFPGRTS